MDGLVDEWIDGSVAGEKPLELLAAGAKFREEFSRKRLSVCTGSYL